jgi:diguanylate cyclase (GGDEF)-like protein
MFRFSDACRVGVLSVCLLCAWLLPAQAPALDLERPISQFSHVWYENQLPQGTVLSIAQREDGTIWLATYGGLVRHSGAGFEALDSRAAPALKSSAVTAVARDGKRGLWVGTLNGGLYRRQGHELHPVALPEGVDSVFGVVTDTEGTVWLTTNAGVVRMAQDQPRLLGAAEGFPPRGFFRAIVADPVGGVWIATDAGGLFHWRDGQVRTYTQAEGLPSNAVLSLAIDAAGTVWAGTQAGPAYLREGRFVREPRAAALDGSRVFSLYGDRQGAVWFAPLHKGLCRLTPSSFECDTSLDGMRGETVRSMFEDREGNLWLGTTSSGLHRLSQSKLVTVVGPMESNAVRAVHAAPDGQVWVGTDGSGLARYYSPSLLPVPGYNRQLRSQLVRAIHTDRDGRLWVAGTEGVSRFERNGRARHFGLDDGMPGTIAFAFAEAPDGSMWVGTLQGLARIQGDQVQVVEQTRGDDTRALYQAPDGRLWIGMRTGLRCLTGQVLHRCGTDGLPGSSVFAFHAAANGELWLGTSMGIVRIRGSKVTSYHEAAGFHGDAVFALLDDGRGNLWFSSNRGIGHIAKSDFEAFDRGEKAVVRPRWYGIADGMLNAQGNGASQSPAARTADGRLWFGTPKGVVIVDPGRIQGNPLPPPVAIERLFVDGVETGPGPDLRLPAGSSRLELHFAGMSYVAPAAVQYRYRLQGFDRTWNEVGNTRSAAYTNLPPGDYVFQVMASNNDGVWNEEAASLRFTLLPLWHQTWWVRGLGVLAGLGLVVLWIRLRLRTARRREHSLTLEVEQRTEALREANERLQHIATIDALTGIANRREFNRRLLQAWEDHARRDAPLGLLLVDVDEFKAYNDSYGHLGGDAALATVAGLLAGQVRDAHDLTARYGGEEFAVLLPDCDEQGACEVAERMVRAMHARALPHRASRVTGIITVSIGTASMRPGQGGNPDALLHAADEALYRAKDQGRDRAVAG